MNCSSYSFLLAQEVYWGFQFFYYTHLIQVWMDLLLNKQILLHFHFQKSLKINQWYPACHQNQIHSILTNIHHFQGQNHSSKFSLWGFTVSPFCLMKTILCQFRLNAVLGILLACIDCKSWKITLKNFGKVWPH